MCVPGLAPDHVPGARPGLPPPQPPDSLGVSWAFSSYLSPQLSAALQRTHCDAWPGSHGRQDRASLPRRPLTGLNEALCAHLRPCVCPGRDPRRPAGTRVASTECEMLPGTGPGAAGAGQEPGRRALRAEGLGGDVVGSWGCKARAKWPKCPEQGTGAEAAPRTPGGTGGGPPLLPL